MTAAYVTDTHPLVFHATGGRNLGLRARRIFQNAEAGRGIIYVPIVVLWEISLLLRVGRIQLAYGSISSFSEDLFSNQAFQPHPIGQREVCLAESYRSNSDPFDALIASTGLALGLPVITRDATMSATKGLKTVW